jgi:hypothetical protein
MSDPATIEEDESTQVSPGSRVLAWLGGTALLLVVFVLFMHVFAPTIASDEASPEGHPRLACIACHIVTGPSEGAETP